MHALKKIVNNPINYATSLHKMCYHFVGSSTIASIGSTNTHPLNHFNLGST